MACKSRIAPSMSTASPSASTSTSTSRTSVAAAQPTLPEVAGTGPGLATGLAAGLWMQSTPAACPAGVATAASEARLPAAAGEPALPPAGDAPPTSTTSTVASGAPCSQARAAGRRAPSALAAVAATGKRLTTTDLLGSTQRVPNRATGEPLSADGTAPRPPAVEPELLPPGPLPAGPSSTSRRERSPGDGGRPRPTRGVTESRRIRWTP
mmetsp:Transcript_42529/g.108067  ORF Transcript_42529/g.108067 Transcript_42529/m.108067 type:complete len:210 (-) Transcript_42529:27-656(-)